ncbi:ankyrin repeat-containing domain protein [Leptodontidium sp. MPI-SDFR-AT-0119]|nr:ankyrin repeat-containing domain protein [Leptodontidium sp. MPI-SDFR-AT-0119]
MRTGPHRTLLDKGAMPHEPLEVGDPLERTAMSGGSLRGQHIHDLTVTGGQAAVGSFRDVHFQDPRVSDLLERVEEKEQLEILKWISPIQYGKHHDTVKADRTLDTCEWLLQDERFRKWEDDSSSVILWLQGSPGAGKTFLTSKVIDHVRSRLESSPSQEGFAFFYCNRGEEERREPLSVLRSYTRQLSTTVGHPEEMRKKLRALWRETTLRGSDLSFEACREQLFESVNLYPRTTLVLDALDECDPGSRRKLIDAIKLLLSKSERPLKVFISSRPDRDIRFQFLSGPNIEIQARHNEKDIRKFVYEEIINHGGWRDMFPSLQEEIVKTLLDRSQGMFQWVYLQIKQILDLESEEAIRDRLGKLPTGLKATYDEIYGKKAQNKHDKALADRALMWVMCAYKPLSSEELLSAIRLDPKDTICLAGKITESQLLHLCNNLLVLDSQRNVWRFSHLSVTEYFEENHWGLRLAHYYAAKVCLGLLIKTYKEPRTSNVDSLSDNHDYKSRAYGIFNPKHSLQEYSRHYWITHIQTQEEQEADPLLADLLKAFLGSPGESSLQYRQWYLQVKADQYNRPLTSIFRHVDIEEISPENSTVFAMCRFSFYTLLSNWWRNAEIPLLQTNSQGNSLLTLAAAAGCRSICEALIKRGAQVNLQGGELGSALAAASAAGKTKTVKYLVEQGADVNLPLQTGYYGNALAAAAKSGHTETVKYLVEQGADVNLPLQTGGYGSALAAAAKSGHTETVKYLVEQGADVNLPLQTGGYGSALVAVASTGRIEIVKYLVEQGADVNLPLQTGYYGSALAAAATYDKTETVKYLIEQGADVNMPLKIGRYGSALATASGRRYNETVKYLVEQGADVNMPLQTGEYGSALAAAAWGGHTPTVKYLIEQGANVNLPLQTGDYGSALAAAATYDKIETVKYLVEQGANVNLPLQTGYYGSALAAAATYGNIETVKYLVEQGADVNLPLQTGRYGSALAAAAYWGWKQCAESLIDARAKVDLKLENGPYSTALHASQADVSQDDRETTWWDRRDEEKQKGDKADVVELLQRLLIGLLAVLTSRCFRRNTGNVVDHEATSAVRDQVMRHNQNSAVYNAAYINERVLFDVQSAVLERPFANGILCMLTHMSLMRDPRAPVHVPDDVLAAFPPDPRIVDLEEQRA